MFKILPPKKKYGVSCEQPVNDIKAKNTVLDRLLCYFALFGCTWMPKHACHYNKGILIYLIKISVYRMNL